MVEPALQPCRSFPEQWSGASPPPRVSRRAPQLEQVETASLREAEVGLWLGRCESCDAHAVLMGVSALCVRWGSCSLLSVVPIKLPNAREFLLDVLKSIVF